MLGLSGVGLDEQQFERPGTTISAHNSRTLRAPQPLSLRRQATRNSVELDLHALQAKGLSPVDV